MPSGEAQSLRETVLPSQALDLSLFFLSNPSYLWPQTTSIEMLNILDSIHLQTVPIDAHVHPVQPLSGGQDVIDHKEHDVPSLGS